MKPVVFLMGPTASGKTALAVELVQRGPFEIVSVDSAMVYRGMDIGTAKPDAATLAVAPHRLIDIRDPAEPYSAADFCRDATAAIAEIHAAGRLPLLVGGTMLYFRALRDGLSALPPADPAVRARLAAELAGQGLAALRERLAAVDPVSAARHGSNPQRLLRALEVWEATGEPLSRLQEAPGRPAPWPLAQLALVPDRAVLHGRIEQRFRAMLAAGLVEEVGQLFRRGDLHPGLPSIRAVGYRQVWDYLAGQTSYQEMEARGIIATRQLAKRQLTWLRGWEGLHRLDLSSPDLAGQVARRLPEVLGDTFY